VLLVDGGAEGLVRRALEDRSGRDVDVCHSVGVGAVVGVPDEDLEPGEALGLLGPGPHDLLVEVDHAHGAPLTVVGDEPPLDLDGPEVFAELGLADDAADVVGVVQESQLVADRIQIGPLLHGPSHQVDERLLLRECSKINTFLYFVN